MTTSNTITTVLVAALAFGTGTTVALAQDAANDNTAVTTPANQNDGQRRWGFRSDERRHGFRGPMRGMGMGGAGMMSQVFTAVDADGDGSITQAEIDAYRSARVQEADADGDGALSIEEFDMIWRQLTRSRMVDMFQNFDEDGDGTITAAEMDARFGSVVQRMDRNGDGALTPEDRGRR